MDHHEPAPIDTDASGFHAAPARYSDTGTATSATERPTILRPVCDRCGSDALIRDASAIWSVAEQCWELAGAYNSTTCQDCGAEADDLADWRPIAADRAAVGATAQDGFAMIYHPGTGTLLAVNEAVMVHLDPAIDGDEAEETDARMHAAGASTLLDVLRSHAIASRG